MIVEREVLVLMPKGGRRVTVMIEQRAVQPKLDNEGILARGKEERVGQRTTMRSNNRSRFGEQPNNLVGTKCRENETPQ